MYSLCLAPNRTVYFKAQGSDSLFQHHNGKVQSPVFSIKYCLDTVFLLVDCLLIYWH